jgi:hypothetical protein
MAVLSSADYKNPNNAVVFSPIFVRARGRITLPHLDQQPATSGKQPLFQKMLARSGYIMPTLSADN